MAMAGDEPRHLSQLVSREQLIVMRDDATRKLAEYDATDPYVLADDLQAALFLLDEKPTDTQRQLLETFG